MTEFYALRDESPALNPSRYNNPATELAQLTTNDND
jgi:hypothetical protein